MTKSKPSRRSLLSIFIGCFLYFLPISLLELDPYDEAIRLYGAEEILSGRRPYQDFYAIYGAAQFVSSAAILQLTGHQIAAMRIALALVNAAIGASLFWLTRRLQVSTAGAIAVVTIFLMVRHSSGNLLYASGPAMLLLLLVSVQLHSKSTIGFSGVGLGLLLGIVGWFRHDFAVYGTFAAIITIALDNSSVSNRVRSVWTLLIAGLVSTLSFYLLFTWPSPFKVWENLIVYPLITMPYRDLPYPWSEISDRLSACRSLFSNRTIVSRTALMELTPVIVLLMPLLTILMTIVASFTKIGRSFYRELASPENRSIRYLVLLSLGLSLYGTMRCGFWHLFPLFIVLLPITFKLLAIFSESFAFRFRERMANVFALCCCGCVVVIGTGRTADYFKRYSIDHPRCRGIRAVDDSAAELARIAIELQALPDNEPIFVGNFHHDRVLTNPIVIYFLSGHRSATYFHHFDPGVTTSEWGQKHIIADIEKSKTTTIVLFRSPLGNEPNRSRESSGNTQLDDYIRSKFVQISHGDSHTVWKRQAERFHGE